MITTTTLNQSSPYYVNAPTTAAQERAVLGLDGYYYPTSCNAGYVPEYGSYYFGNAGIVSSDDKTQLSVHLSNNGQLEISEEPLNHNFIISGDSHYGIN